MVNPVRGTQLWYKSEEPNFGTLAPPAAIEVLLIVQRQSQGGPKFPWLIERIGGCAMGTKKRHKLITG